jgi:hypothetical protein
MYAASFFLLRVGETMFHFPGHYDVSHYQKDPGFYGTRASLATTAREDALANGQSVRLPQPRDGSVGYGQAPTRSPNDRSFYAPPPAESSQRFSAMRSVTAPDGLQTTRVPLAVEGGFGASQRLAQSREFTEANGHGVQYGGSQLASNSTPFSASASYGDKDLWNHPVLPHGDRRSYSNGTPNTTLRPAGAGGSTPATTFHTQSARFGPSGQQSFGASNGLGQSARFGYTQPTSNGTSGGGSGRFEGAALTGLIDPAFVDGPDEWRYDDRGIAMSKGVELRRNTDPRQKFLIPGYSGFVRGKQHHFGNTFGKMTRDCLDIPLDLPTDIDQ